MLSYYIKNSNIYSLKSLPVLSSWDWKTSNFTSIIIPEKELIVFMTLVNYTRTERVCQPLFAKALKLQSCWTKVLGHFAFMVIFQFTQVQPLPSPHKQCWMCVPRIFFRVSTLYRVGGGRTARKFQKGCTVLWGKREMTEKYEYCSTVPRTFVHDCRIRIVWHILTYSKI